MNIGAPAVEDDRQSLRARSGAAFETQLQRCTSRTRPGEWCDHSDQHRRIKRYDSPASERVVPSKVWESTEVGVGSDKCAAVLHRYSGMLGIGDQFPCGPGLAAYSVEDVQVVGSGAHDARGRALN